MTPKERADAIRELKDMAYEHDRRAAMIDSDVSNRRQHVDRAALLRAVAAELAKGAE